MNVLTLSIIVTVFCFAASLKYNNKGEPEEKYHQQPTTAQVKNEGGNHICFKNEDNALPWPIGNPRDIAGAIFHGSHCVDSALDYVASKSDRTAFYLHVSHCRTIVKAALKYFEDHPQYSVPEEICYDLVDLATDESCDRSNGRVRCKRWGHPLILLNVMWGSKPHQRIFPRSAGAEESDVHNVYQDFVPETRDQHELFVRISNENVDKVFTKHWENSSQLTQDELKFVQKWHHPTIHRLSAVGLYCREGQGKGAPIELLKQVLAAMPESEYANVI